MCNININDIWIHVLQDVFISGKKMSVKRVETLLKNRLENVTGEKIQLWIDVKDGRFFEVCFNKKSVASLLAFFKVVKGTPQLANALGAMFKMFSIFQEKKTRGKKVFVSIWNNRPRGFTYEEYPSVKKALEVYGKPQCEFGVTPGIVTRQLKKERLGGSYYNVMVRNRTCNRNRDKVQINFSVADPKIIEEDETIEDIPDDW